MTMGERIERLRKENNWTLEELGNHLGVQKGAIYKYEKGEVENIPRSSIVKMAALFDVTPEYILAFSDEEKAGFVTDEMIHNSLFNKYGEEGLQLLAIFSTMADINKHKLLALSKDIKKAEKYDDMMAVAHK